MSVISWPITRKLAPMPARTGRNGWTQEQSAIHGDLTYWGYRYRRILLSTGYSSFSPFANLRESLSSGINGHRVLIPDMTERAWRVNHEVWALPHQFSWALCARYALPPDEDGRMYTGEQIGEALGCSAALYRQRVKRGRELMRRRAFG